MFKILGLSSFLILTACHDKGYYTERVTCDVNGEIIIYEATRTFGGHGGFQWVSGVGDGTIIRNTGGREIIQYSNAIPCTLVKVDYRER